MNPPQKIQVHSLTSAYNGIANVISSPIVIENINTGIKVNTYAIWDTGATASVITKTMAGTLGLIAIGQTRVKGVHGFKDGIPVYGVRILLNDRVAFVQQVTECEQLTDDNSAEFLIGMDVISKGDFAITNFQGETVMTFRTPSIQRFDFVKDTKAMSIKAGRDSFLKLKPKR